MSVIDNARTALAAYHLNHPDPDGVCEGECGRDLAGVLAALIAEHARLQTDLDARFEHSDHTAAKYYQRMRDAEKEARMRRSESADFARERDEADQRAQAAEKVIAEALEFAAKERDSVRAQYRQTGGAPARYLGYADGCADLHDILSTYEQKESDRD